MKNRILGSLVFVLFLTAGYFLGSMDFGLKDYSVKRERIIMGTVVEILIRNMPQDVAHNAINKAFAEFERIDNLFSTYKKESGVSELNSNLEKVTVDSEIYFILKKCDEITKSTNGAFDAATGNIVDVWNFNSTQPQIPDSEILSEAVDNSGWINVELSDSNYVIKKKRIRFNFGAIAKGYAVDKAAFVLANLGINDFLINAGGEIKTSGKNWKVGIQHPRRPTELIKSLLIEDYSVATSGDYEQYFELTGKRYHHILNPKTGYPARDIQSVTIVAKDNFVADAYATGVFVLGKDKGLALIESIEAIEGMIITESGEIINSSGFNKYVWR